MKTEWLFANSIKRRRIVTIVLLVIVVMLVSSVFTFKANLDQSLRDNATDRLMDMADNQALLVRAQLAGTATRSGSDSLHDQLQRIVEDSGFARKYGGTLFVAGKHGELLACSGQYSKQVWESGSLAGFLQALAYPKGEDAALIADRMAVAVRDSAVVQFAGQKQLMTYTPMEVEEWYLFTMQPYSSIDRDVRRISREAYGISAKLLLAFSLVLAYLLVANRRQLEELREQQKEMRATAARYKLISARSRDVIVEYDLRKRLVMHCENGGVLSSAEMRGVNFISAVVARGVIHPEDAGLFHEQAQRAASGKEDVELDLRVKLTMCDYSWYHLSMACVFDEAGRPWRVLVRGTNIDQQKREQQLLEQRAVRDPLTRLYNKGATRNEIEKLLQESPARCHTLMIIDVDNFKHFNDNFGHMFGDKVLTCAATQLQELFRSNDVVGRVGGDEFMVFCRDIGTPQNAARLAQQVVAMFRQVGGMLEPSVATSCSAGVAVCPQDGADFEALYAHADMALYSVKKKGKDGFALFGEAAMASGCGSPE